MLKKILSRFFLLFLLSFLLSGCFAGLFDDTSPDSSVIFSNVRKIAFLRVEYMVGYQNMGAAGFSTSLKNILRTKGYSVVDELQLGELLAKKGYDLPPLLDDEKYSIISDLRIADIGVIATFQERALSGVSLSVNLIDLDTRKIIWYSTRRWERYRKFSEMPLQEELRRFFISIPYSQTN